MMLKEHTVKCALPTLSMVKVKKGVCGLHPFQECVVWFGELGHVGQGAVQTAPSWMQALRAVGSVSLDVLLRTV